MNTFQVAVDQALGENCWKRGISALKGKDKGYVQSGGVNLQGSVYLDDCLKHKSEESRSSRWDYAIGCTSSGKQVLCLIEIHPFSKVDEVLDKAEWLREWLKGGGHALDTWANQKCWYWIQTGEGKKGRQLNGNEHFHTHPAHGHPGHPAGKSRRQVSQKGISILYGRRLHLQKACLSR